MTMSEGTGPSSDERHSADANGDHRFSYDEEPQRRQKQEEAAHDDDRRLGRETFGRWYRGAHRSLHRKTGRYASIGALTPVLGFVRPCKRIARSGQAGSRSPFIPRDPARKTRRLAALAARGRTHQP